MRTCSSISARKTKRTRHTTSRSTKGDLMKNALLSLGYLLALGTSLNAQWPAFPAPGVTRTSDGKVDLTAPAPRVNGKPDLSGLWRARPDPLGQVGGVENVVF